LIRWITDKLGTASWDEAAKVGGITRVDVRDMVDKAGNSPDVVRGKLDATIASLNRGEKVVVCCDYGMSRSNAVAAGALARLEGIGIDEAIRRVLVATNETGLRVEVLWTVRQALSSEVAAKQHETANRGILLTGGTGFVGSALSAALIVNNRQIIVPNRGAIDLFRGAAPLDLAIRVHSVDTLIHLANPRIYTTNESLGDSLVMLKNVLDACCQNGTLLIWLSSWEVFSGYKAKELCADESLAPCPGSTYGCSKVLCENLINHYKTRLGLKCVILRSAPVYGAGSDKPKFIWNFFDKAKKGHDIVAHEYVNGYPALDLLNVSDLCSAIVAAIDRRITGTFNIGTGVGTTTTEIASQVVSLVGSQSKIRHHRLEAYTSNIIMKSDLAGEKLNWKPAVQVRDGLATLLGHAGLPEFALDIHQAP
jgi:UDP-glucuronate decarboxylase